MDIDGSNITTPTLGNRSIDESSQISNSVLTGLERYDTLRFDLTLEELSELNAIVTIVIPTLNEHEAIGKVLDELFSIGMKNILIVDGYSSDGTLETIKKYPVSTISQHGKGKTGALRTAFENVKTSYMIVMDGDFTYDPSCIYRFLEHMRSYDQIVGIRNLDDKKNMSVLHKLGNKIITKSFNVLMGTDLSDVCCGMYALKTKVVENINLSSTGFDVEAEIAAHIASSGRITEVPINYRQRIGKQKLSTWKNGFKILYTILKLAMTYRPRVFYSTVVGILSLLGIGILANTIIEWSITKTLAVPWLLIGNFVLMLAVYFAGVDLQAQMLKRMESKIMQQLKLQK